MGHSAIQSLQVFEESGFKLTSELGKRRPAVANTFDNLVLNICDIHHVFNRVALELQIPADQITKYESAPIANVGKIVNRRPATVHPDPLACGIQRPEVL